MALVRVPTVSTTRQDAPDDRLALGDRSQVNVGARLEGHHARRRDHGRRASGVEEVVSKVHRIPPEGVGRAPVSGEGELTTYNHHPEGLLSCVLTPKYEVGEGRLVADLH